MNIIPAIDILDGKCVRLSRGDYATQKIYNEDPLEVALEFEAHGISHLHLVDLDGARSKHIVNHKVLEKITCKTTLVVDFGGGLKTAEDLQKAFDHGASQVTLGSIAVTDPDLFAEWLSVYGAQQIILGADCNQRKIATHGWLQQSSLDVLDFIKGYAAKGISTVTCTDITKDGMLQGPSLDLYRDILQAVPVQLIASGGITSLSDLEELQHIGCAGAIIGKAIYEGHITLKELSALC